MAKSLNPFAKQIFNTECMNLCHNQGFNNDLLAEIVYKLQVQDMNDVTTISKR